MPTPWAEGLVSNSGFAISEVCDLWASHLPSLHLVSFLLLRFKLANMKHLEQCLTYSKYSKWVISVSECTEMKRGKNYGRREEWEGRHGVVECRQTNVLSIMGLTFLLSFIPETAHPKVLSQRIMLSMEWPRVLGTVHEAGQCSMPCWMTSNMSWLAFITFI